MKEQTLSITIEVNSEAQYVITVAGGTPRENVFTTEDGLPGLRGRLNAIAENLGQYLEPDDVTAKVDAPAPDVKQSGAFVSATPQGAK